MPASIIVALSFLVCALPCFIVAYAVGGGGIRKQKACTAHVTGTVVGMSNFSSNGIRLPKVEYTVNGVKYTTAGPKFSGSVNFYIEAFGKRQGTASSNLSTEGELPQVVKTTKDQSSAQQIMRERYPAGKQVDVFYDPEKPKRCYVERYAVPPKVWSIYMPTGLGIIFTLVALILLIVHPF